MSDNDANGKEEAQKSHVLKFSIIIFTLALFLSVGAFFITPKIHEHSMNEELKNLQSNSGSITVENNKLQDMDKINKNVKIASANSHQKYLTTNGVNFNGIVYFNGKNVKNRKIVDLYVNLNDFKSKDFINLNGGLLKSLVESGRISLNIHPINNGDKNSILTGEALAESAAAYPSQSWNYLTNITKMNNNSSSGAQIELAKTAKRLNLNFIDEKSINNGTFATWLYNLNNDSKVKSGFAPPIIYVDNKLIDSQKININDPSTLESAISNE